MKIAGSKNFSLLYLKCLLLILFICTFITVQAASLEIFGLPDPTQRLNAATHTAVIAKTYKPDPLRKLTLQSILYSGSRKSVVINGQVKQLGATINGAKIIAINNNNVVLSRHKRLLTLRIKTSQSVTRTDS